MKTPAEGSGETRRYLVEVRGVLEIDASSANAANALAEQWIAAAQEGEHLLPLSDADAESETADNRAVRVLWLRREP